MSIIDTVNRELSKPTFIFGIQLWVLVGIGIGTLILLILCCIICCCCKSKSTKSNVSKARLGTKNPNSVTSNDTHKIVKFSSTNTPPDQSVVPPNLPEFQIDIGETEHHQVVVSDRRPSWAHRYRESLSTAEIELDLMASAPEVTYLKWVHGYTLRELKEATNKFSDDNVIGEGNYGIVYRGVLPDDTLVAVKSLFNNRGQAEKDFKAEVEAIGHIRHKNLVTLLGYCVEGASRMLVFEYLENGNLNQWLHRDVMQVSPLSWDIRMNIILGTAKSLTYLHDGLEPKIVHRDVKSCNILLNQQWNPKVSDFGFAKLLCSEMSHVTTRVMGTYGYVAPEYACTGLLNERSDVYSFGVLVMEIVSGRIPEEMNLVDWLKRMVENQRYDEIVDPRLPELPSSKALKRVLLIALRCVDPEALQRPKMGQVVHLLEAENLQYADKLHITREASRSRRCLST